MESEEAETEQATSAGCPFFAVSVVLHETSLKSQRESEGFGNGQIAFPQVMADPDNGQNAIPKVLAHQGPRHLSYVSCAFTPPTWRDTEKQRHGPEILLRFRFPRPGSGLCIVTYDELGSPGHERDIGAASA